MINTEKSLSPWIAINDESLNTNNSYDLYLISGIDTLQFAVIDNDRNKYVALHDYNLQSIKPADVSEKTEIIITQDELLQQYKDCFRKVFVSIASPKCIIVPSAFYDEPNKKQLLGFNFDLDNNEIVLGDKSRQIDSYFIYTIDLHLLDFFNTFFSKTVFHHAFNSFTEGVILQNKNHGEKIVSVNVSHNSFVMLVTEGKKLHYHNVFSYQSTEDFIYYLLFAAEQLQLNPETVTFYFSGMIEKNSALYLLSQKYIRNLRFTQRPDFCDFSYRFNEIASHYHYCLYNQYLCAL